MDEALLAPNFLFRFAAPCRYRDLQWSSRGVDLEEDCRLPSFGELEGRQMFADVRTAWNEAGLFFSVRVSGKKQLPWCRGTRVEDSDGLQLWIATRDIQGIHRANRFCHRLAFLPLGEGTRLDEPVATTLSIARARELPRPIASDRFGIYSENRIDGYVLHVWVPGDALTGFDATETTMLGFSYAVVDRELGWQTFSIGPEFPFVSDPSLWGQLELQPAATAVQ
ncbi:MAG: hypothetical protein MK364_05560 [Pirellulales bacterium]|nr:hypothetical protein [Pirellulales bacterium]